jgi:hypothetical protein
VVHVLPAFEDVSEAAAVAVDRVEARIRFEADARAGGEEARERRPCLVCVALALPELGRVDLDEPDALPPNEPDRIAVDDLGDRARRSGAGVGAVGRDCGEAGERDKEEVSRPGHQPTVGGFRGRDKSGRG